MLIPTLSARLFNWHGTVGSVEVADLPRPITHESRFMVVSPITGRVEEFNLIRTDFDATREDIYGWEFAPKSNELRAKGVRILIIND